MCHHILQVTVSEQPYNGPYIVQASEMCVHLEHERQTATYDRLTLEEAASATHSVLDAWQEMQEALSAVASAP